MYYASVRAKAQKVLDDTGLSGAARVPLSQIAKHLGLSIEYLPCDDGVVEGICLSCLGEGLLRVKRRKYRPRLRFTVAHEIGHYVLGHSLDISFCGLPCPLSPQETEANVWASELLMPRAAFQREIQNAGGVASIDNLSSVFEVSRAAAKFRTIDLYRLGVLSFSQDSRAS
ncbi:MAG: ImmA/IrrE family metallo-endopeptidase [Synergistales bacterium]|nr:ImmA/IrrE family metallo-endopeptidase [Synergistales bacterium]